MPKADTVIGGGAAGWEPGARCGPASASCLAHTIVRRADGTSWVWGLNSFGQLGNAMQGVNSPTPVPVEL